MLKSFNNFKINAAIYISFDHRSSLFLPSWTGSRAQSDRARMWCSDLRVQRTKFNRKTEPLQSIFTWFTFRFSKTRRRKKNQPIKTLILGNGPRLMWSGAAYTKAEAVWSDSRWQPWKYTINYRSILLSDHFHSITISNLFIQDTSRLAWPRPVCFSRFSFGETEDSVDTV